MQRFRGEVGGGIFSQRKQSMAAEAMAITGYSKHETMKKVKMNLNSSDEKGNRRRNWVGEKAIGNEGAGRQLGRSKETSRLGFPIPTNSFCQKLQTDGGIIDAQPSLNLNKYIIIIITISKKIKIKETERERENFT